MAKMHSIFLIFSLISISRIADAHNITDILSGFPEYSVFNDYLTKTKLSDEINYRQSVTVLVLNNATASALAKLPISTAKNILSIHILLDYFETTKIKQMVTTQTTTLYQTTGKSPGKTGFVDVTDLKNGKFGFCSAAVPGSEANSTLVKEVKQIPYNLSVLEISAPIVPPGVIDASAAPAAADVNITDVVEKAGAATFASLIVQLGLLDAYKTVVKTGLTIFAPADAAFDDKTVMALGKLNNDQKVALLRYHAVGNYMPIGSLKANKESFSTLASSSDGKYTLNATTAGDEVTLHAGLDSSKIAEILLDSTPLVIFKIDTVLLPAEIFGKSPAPAPAPAVNITAELEKAGLKTFTSLIGATNVLGTYLDAEKKGLTIFAPSDAAFDNTTLSALNKLNDDQKVVLLNYHAVADYFPIALLKQKKGPISTLATDGDSKYTLMETNVGDNITLIAGSNDVPIAATIIDSNPVVIYKIDHVLLPKELFPKSPAPSPVPAAPASNVDIKAALEKAGLKTFAMLINQTGVIKDYWAAEKNGLTIFAPADEAFATAAIQAALKTLKPDQVVALLKYHAVGNYTPIVSLKANKDSFSTLATNGDGTFTLNATSSGDEVTLNAGQDKSKISETVIDSKPVVIYKIDSVLLPLPSELSGNSSSPPKPTPEGPPADVPAPAPTPSAAGDTILSGLVKALVAVSAVFTFTMSFH